MSVVVGLLLGMGLLLIWQSFWTRPANIGTRTRKPTALDELILASGVGKINTTSLIIAATLCGVVTFAIFTALTRAIPIGICFGLVGLSAPFVILRWQANKNRTARRHVWPDAIDHLRSAIRAGLTLPEALSQLAEQGPDELRDPLEEFRADYRSGFPFIQALDRLKDRFADPVADRLISALKITREVGGADIGTMLEALSEFLREDARTRAELETRQQWTVNGARLAVVAPWLVLLLMATQPAAVEVYQSVTGLVVLLTGLAVSVVCYRLMLMIGALPTERRVL